MVTVLCILCVQEQILPTLCMCLKHEALEHKCFGVYAVTKAACRSKRNSYLKPALVNNMPHAEDQSMTYNPRQYVSLLPGYQQGNTSFQLVINRLVTTTG